MPTREPPFLAPESAVSAVCRVLGGNRPYHLLCWRSPQLAQLPQLPDLARLRLLRRVGASVAQSQYTPAQIAGGFRNFRNVTDQTNRSASQLLDHAMVLYRAERPETEEFSILHAISEIVTQVKLAADLRDLDLTFSTDVSPTQTVNLDRTLFETSVRNLLDNALKYALSETTIMIEFKKTKPSLNILGFFAESKKSATDLLKKPP